MNIPSLLWIILATLMGWWLILPTVNTLKLPLGKTFGIISHMVELGRNPSTNIAIYLLLILIPNLLILGFLSFRDRLKRLFMQPWQKLTQFLTHPRILPILVSLLLFVWVVNITAPTPEFALGFAKDSFHFGEKIGLTPAYLQAPHTFFQQNYILIHGFGKNVLPGLIGRWLGGEDGSIAFTIYVVYLQSLLAVAFSFLILYEIAIFLAPQRRWYALITLSLVYFSLHGIVFNLIDRDTLFILQAYLTLRWLRFSQTKWRSEETQEKRLSPRFLYPFWIAFLLPLNILYVYDRAVYSIAILVCSLVYLFITTDKGQWVRTGMATLAGLFSASLLISLSFGVEVLPNAIGQIRYWSKVSGLFTALPYPSIEISVKSLINWLPIFLQSLTLSLFCLSLREECFIGDKKFKTFLSEHYLPLFLFLSAIFYMRVALGRSDGGHLISPGFFAIFAFVSLVVHIFSKRQLYQGSWQTLLVCSLIATCLFNMNGVLAAINLQQLTRYPGQVQAMLTPTNDQLVAADQSLVVKRLERRFKSQSCFYSLTSEGLWYELLDKPPCSRYWYLIYATTPDTQAEVIQDLQITKPRVILYSGGFGDVLDGIPKEASHLPVHQYVWQHYRPWRTVQGRWFWIRRGGNSNFTNLLVPQPNAVKGNFDEISQTLPPSLKLVARGWAAGEMGGSAQTSTPPESATNPQTTSQKNVILLTANPVDHPEQILPINVGQTTLDRPDVEEILGDRNLSQTGWSISTHELGLPIGNFEMKAWIYSPTDYKFYQIPQSHSFTIKR
ncbi:MAG: hypothetical protein MUF49_10435 [Oculatellaceae cyanobacterium Prado106]|jgi:hypothetical protein|nr:hypothetical protein [Oculatellaceae cyanobacterium Prado106]